MKMIYKLPVSLDKEIILELPMPLEKLSKGDRKKLFNGIIESVKAQVNSSRIEQHGRYNALLEEAKKIRKEWGFTKNHRRK